MKTWSRRYVKSPVVVRFLPGVLLFVELFAPEHLSPRIVPGGGDERNATCTLHARRVIFSSSLSMFSSINMYLDSPRRRLPLSSTRQVVVELGECRISTARAATGLS